MLAYLRSSAFLALALAALVGADALPQALLALAPLVNMLAYLQSPSVLGLAAALVGADSFLNGCQTPGTPRNMIW